jgi:hypothetical protein
MPFKYFGGKNTLEKIGRSPPWTRSFTSKEQFFSGLLNLSSLHKIGWGSAEKITPFSNTLLLA